jgi:hypothetical protein
MNDATRFEIIRELADALVYAHDEIAALEGRVEGLEATLDTVTHALDAAGVPGVPSGSLEYRINWLAKEAKRAASAGPTQRGE